MSKPRLKYVVHADDDPILTHEQWLRADNYVNGWIIKPTIKSAQRYAQKAANATGVPFVFYIRKANKKGLITRSFICYPVESESFLELM